MHDYAGAIHLHSNYSFDGHASVDEIVRAAKSCGLDFVVLTDHFRLDAKKDGWEGWHDGVLLIVGEEISPRYNHYLAMDIASPIIEWRKRSKPQEYIDAVNKQGGFGLIAHPDHSGAPEYGVKEYSWKDWSVTGFTGISIWDFMTDWQSKLAGPLRAVMALLFPAWMLSGPKEVTLKRWDELNITRKVLGFGEQDNHKTPRKPAGFKFNVFEFERLLNTVTTHVLLDEPLSRDRETAKKQIYSALKNANAYVAQEYWNRAKGFTFTISGGAKASIGGEIKLNGGKAEAAAMFPQKAAASLLCNGKAVFGPVYAKDFRTDINKPGVYRVEAMQKICGFSKPWIYSNHIRVLA
jgi:hypothetical protein